MPSEEHSGAATLQETLSLESPLSLRLAGQQELRTKPDTFTFSTFITLFLCFLNPHKKFLHTQHQVKELHSPPTHCINKHLMMFALNFLPRHFFPFSLLATAVFQKQNILQQSF